MNIEFIESIVRKCTYRLKEGTSSSYYWEAGDKILPNRLSISVNSEITRAKHTGRMLANQVIGEVKGTFKNSEKSPLKQYNPFRVHSKIFLSEDFPALTGWATIGITGEGGKITRDSEEGILVFNDVGEGVIQIYEFIGFKPAPRILLDILGYVSEVLSKSKKRSYGI